MGYSYDYIPKNYFEAINIHIVEEIKMMLKTVIDIYQKISIANGKSISSYGFSSLPTRKAEMVELIINLLSSDEFLQSFYNMLNDTEKSAVKEAVYSSNGVFDIHRFTAKYGNAPDLKIDHYSNKKTINPLRILIPTKRIIPADLKERLLTFVPEPDDVCIKSYNDIPNETEFDETTGVELITHKTEHAAIHDIKAILQLINSSKIGAGSKTGYITASGANSIRGVLLNGDFYENIEADNEYDVQMGHAGIRPLAWPLILQAGKMAKVEGSRLIVTKKGNKALTMQSHDILKELWDRWIDNNLIHEMRRIDVIKGQRSKRHPLNKASHCRAAIEDGLSELPQNKWIELDEFFRFLIAKGHDFVAARDPWSLYIVDREYGSFGYNHITWKHLNGRFAMAFLLEYAATMGIIDVAIVPPWGAADDIRSLWGADEYSCLSRYDGLKYIRLTPLGSWLLGIDDKYIPQSITSEVTFKVLPNMEITILSSKLLHSDRLSIERFCEQKSERVWGISRKKILLAIEKGTNINDIKNFFIKSSDGNIPRSVEVFFDDIDRKAVKLNYVGQCSLVLCDDEATALLLANDNQLKKFCLLSENRYIVIKNGFENKFRNIARKMGYVLPVMERKLDHSCAN